ncbi:diacylglycerol kinase family protein [Streptomyces sp. NBC_00191]|uniref:diacylglycerol kinase family protein n=1 Tax=Streptomyces sp. NBC_00191 TaxID=2975674 RepID=UPI00386B3C53
MLGQAAKDVGARGGALGIAGGDGTVNAAAVLAAEGGLPLAVFPAGTLNHLATDLRYRPSSPPPTPWRRAAAEPSTSAASPPMAVRAAGPSTYGLCDIRSRAKSCPTSTCCFRRAGVEFATVAARPEISGRAATAAVTRG